MVCYVYCAVWSIVCFVLYVLSVFFCLVNLCIVNGVLYLLGRLCCIVFCVLSVVCVVCIVV